MPWSEDRIHRWLLASPRLRGLVGGPGHDAAVLERIAGRPVVCVDQTVEGVHFLASAGPARVGRKAAARALSDLAATAAAPRALLLALGVPASRTDRWIEAVIGGVRAEAGKAGAALVGGDLSIAPRAVLAVSALGELGGRGRPPSRDRARPGQCVVLTGPVGGSALGRHLAIVPRLAEGRWLHALGASAMMDVSDGLAWDLFRLARRSGVRIDLEAVPVHPHARKAARASGRSPEWHALHDGEDHELVATLSASACACALRGAAEHCPRLAVIGRVHEGKGLHLRDGAGWRAWRPDEGGYRHGS